MGGRGRTRSWRVVMLSVVLVGALVTPAAASHGLLVFDIAPLEGGAPVGNQIVSGTGHQVVTMVDPHVDAVGWRLVMDGRGASVAAEVPAGCEAAVTPSVDPLAWTCTVPAELDDPPGAWLVETTFTATLDGSTETCLSGNPCVDLFLQELDEFGNPTGGYGRVVDVVAPPSTPQADLDGGLFVVAGDPDADGVVLTGDPVTVRVSARNIGPDTATGVVAHVELPTGMTADELDLPIGCVLTPGAFTAPSRVDCDLGSIATGAVVTRDLVIASRRALAFFDVDLVGFGSTSEDPAGVNDTASLTLEVQQRVTELAVDVYTTGVPDRLLPGEPVATTVIVENTVGSDAAPGTTLVVEALATSSDVEIAPALGLPPTCTLDPTSPPTVTCDLDLAAYDGVSSMSDQFVLDLEVTWLSPGTRTVRATVVPPASGRDSDASDDTDTDTVVVATPTADLSAVVTPISDVDGDGVVHAGDRHTVLVSAVNGGPDVATDTELLVTVDRPSTEVVLDGLGCASRVAPSGSTAIACPVGDVAVGVASSIVPVSVTIATPGVATVSVYASSPAVDTDGGTTARPLEVRDPDVDADGDGIAGGVDGARQVVDDPSSFLRTDTTPSAFFSDQSRPRDDGLGFGATHGQVVTGGFAGTIGDAGTDDEGVVVTTTPTQSVGLQACDRGVTVEAGSRVVLTCGSLVVDVEIGTARVELGDGATLEVSAGGLVVVDEDAAGSTTIEVVEGTALLETEDGTVELEPGTHRPFGDSTVDDLRALVDGLDADQLANRGSRRALQSLLDNLAEALAADDLEAAHDVLDLLDRRTDGCGVVADRDDWVVDCDAQADLQDLVIRLRADLAA